jgi:tyrosyl-tRNA synthetase
MVVDDTHAHMLGARRHDRIQLRSPPPPPSRGYIHQVTDAAALDALAGKQVVPGYIGFDATAPSLHVGSLVQIMMLRRLQQTGHKPIVLMGGGTSKIGDPSFKDEARRMLTTETIAAELRIDQTRVRTS